MSRFRLMVSGPALAARLTFAGLTLAGLAPSAPADAQSADPVPDLRPFLRQSVTVIALADAISRVEDCPAPLDFRPGEDGEFITLTITCAAILEETVTVTAVFAVEPRSGDTPWLEPVDIRVTGPGQD